MATKKINGVYHVSNTQTGGSGDDPNAVKYVEQELTEAQQTQARTNIGALGEADILDPLMTYTHEGDIDPLVDPSAYATEEELNQLSQEVGEFKDVIQDRDGESLYVTDLDGNVIAKIDNNGIESVEAKAGDAELSKLSPILGDFYEDRFYVTDSDGNVVLSLGANGLKTIGLNAPNVLLNSWAGKRIATYGDSITAINNGDFSYPYNSTELKKWGNKVANFFSFSKQYGRGIGSTTLVYLSHGGQVAWCNSTTGEYVGRDDSYNYDNYSGTIPSGCSACRGSGSSWLRIKTMFPAEIKDTIDVVLIQFHNDYHQDLDTDVSWVAGSTVDPEWAADTDYYSVLGGDYNIGSVKGGLASTIMKMQAWMPNAVIVIMTPISGVYATSDGLDGNFDNTQSALMAKFAKCVKDVAFRMSIPCIDVYGTDGINSLNRTRYIYDNIHPYTDNGNTAVARAIIGGLSSIVANI